MLVCVDYDKLKSLLAELHSNIEDGFCECFCPLNNTDCINNPTKTCVDEYIDYLTKIS